MEFSSTSNAGDCSRCGSSDNWRTVSSNKIQNVKFTVICTHCNPCGNEELRVKFGDMEFLFNAFTNTWKQIP